jgi:hypothetical protein
MSLGREPILLSCQVLTLGIASWPTYSAATEAQNGPNNSWASESTEGPADVSAEPLPEAHSSLDPSGELPDPWATLNSGRVGQAPLAEAWQDEAQADAALDDSPPDTGSDEVTQSHQGVPRYSFWFGPGLSWSVPFGDLWGHCGGFDVYGRCAALTNTSARHYFGSGPAVELDAGARLARHYNLYALWERTWYSAGNTTELAPVHQNRGESDFLALGLRVTTTPETLGFVLDIAVGTRRMRARWDDGTELQLTEAPFETRLGVGANIRVDENWSFTPLIHLGLGSFGKVQWVLPNGTVQSASDPSDVSLTHGWVGLQLAMHADVFGTKN